MDLGEKLKYYQTNSDKQQHRISSFYGNLCDELKGYRLNPDESSPIKIEYFLPYDFFLPYPFQMEKPFISIPLLSRGQFLSEFSLYNILIFDLETTGLAGGTGTYPFLIGFGIFEKNGVRLYQYFLPDYGMEAAAFLDIRNLSEKRNIILSYNGKSFDYPLLNNRYILNRLDNPFKRYAHLDLLHIARRLWKTSLLNCSLENIEREIFLFERLQDIESGLIPFAYFEFLRNGALHQIKKILTHNQQDLISLARLLIHFNRKENAWLEDQVSHHELQMLCKLAIHTMNLERADFYLEEINIREVALTPELMSAFSLLLKRKGKWSRAEKIWLNFISNGSNILFAHEELAKYYEHRKKDLMQAKFHTEQALKYITIVDEINDQKQHSENGIKFEQRLGRLNKKIVAS